MVLQVLCSESGYPLHTFSWILVYGCYVSLQYHIRRSGVPYSRKFLQYVDFLIESLIRIFTDKISWMAYNEASLQLKMMLSSEFPHTTFSLQLQIAIICKNCKNFRLYKVYI